MSEFMHAILSGTLYPAILLNTAIRKTHQGIKKKTKNGDVIERVVPEIASLIKAYLNRYHRVHPTHNHKEIQMSLDINQPSAGYQLGRLFAALERIQEDASPGLNATIRERFYGAACANPVTVFANLLRLKNHHIAKIENQGLVVNREKLLGEIMGRLSDFPPHLDLHEQGRFALGYYHQRQDFYSKKDNDNKNAESASRKED
jgi:CRISPR-associated protein Csd1